MQSIYFVVNLYWTPFFVASAAFIITSGVLSLKYTHFLSYFFFWCDHSSAWQKWVFRYQHEFMYKVMAHNEAGRMLRDIASSNFDTNIDIRRFYLTICRRNKRIWWPRTFFRRFGADKAPHTHTHTHAMALNEMSFWNCGWLRFISDSNHHPTWFLVNWSDIPHKKSEKK